MDRHITFTVHTATLLDAAQLEEYLRKGGFEYDYRAINGHAQDEEARPTKRRRRKNMWTQAERDAVIQYARAHPHAGGTEIRDATGVPQHPTTINSLLRKVRGPIRHMPKKRSK